MISCGKEEKIGDRRSSIRSIRRREALDEGFDDYLRHRIIGIFDSTRTSEPGFGIKSKKSRKTVQPVEIRFLGVIHYR